MFSNENIKSKGWGVSRLGPMNVTVECHESIEKNFSNNCRWQVPSPKARRMQTFFSYSLEKEKPFSLFILYGNSPSRRPVNNKSERVG